MKLEGESRIGARVPLNVYDESGRPVCQCHTEEDARTIVSAVNHLRALKYLRTRVTEGE